VRDTHLQLIVRTPLEVVLESAVSSIRVPTETGLVGVRPRVEPLILALEPGLVLLRQDDVLHFVGTAGGLLRCDGVRASVLTPLAVVGSNEDEVLTALEEALATPHTELEVRTTFGRLQHSILRELRHGAHAQRRPLGERS
jgi:F0F1-type ATP synthase epsilon subunit